MPVHHNLNRIKNAVTSAKNMNISSYLKQAVRNVKSFVVNKAMSQFDSMNPINLVSNYTSKNASKVSDNAAEIQALMKKSPFERNKDRATSIKETDPLSFQHVQYPSDLTGNELGNWILFFTIDSNLHKPKSRNATLKMSSRMGMPKASETDEFRKTVGPADKTWGVGGKDRDLMREQYATRGIHIPRVVKDNTVSAGYGTSDMVSSAIALYMPPDIKVSYGVEWGPDDAMLAGDVSKLWTDIKDSNLSGWDLVSDMLTHGTGIAVMNIEKALSELGSGAGMGDWIKIMGKNMGMAINNHKEQLFDSPNFREFSYQFKFWPRNQDETNRVQNIITLFKYHMHPWKDEATWQGRVFQYPSEFEIHYLKNDGQTGGVNDKLHKISRCALKKCDVSYTPEGGNYKTFADHSPVTYTVDLTFIELEFMTKQKILAGY
jgi:hypothetical protein